MRLLPTSTRFPRQCAGNVFSFILITSLLWIPSTAVATEFDQCARGIGDKFTQTAHVHLSIDGPDLGQYADGVIAILVNRHLWQGHAQDVFVNPYDEALCSAALGDRANMTLSITQSELEQLISELNRSRPSESPAVAALQPTVTGNFPYFTLRIFYATNRKDTGSANPKERFVGDRGEKVSFGAVHVTIPKDHRMGELETPSILRLDFYEDPVRHITLQSLQPLDQDSWRRELQMRAIGFGQPGVLLFIHGYNVVFSDAAIRTAQLAYDLAFQGPALFFSWPSSGELTPYTVDEQMAEWSISHMKAVLADLANLGQGVPVYVIAHSMGNRVLMRAFKDLLDEDLRRRHTFREVVLTAPDIDAEVFKKQIAPTLLSGLVPHVTLYASSNDVALAASRKVHGGYVRLGESGPDLTVVSGMDTVDASHVKTDFLGHSYFADNSTVMADLFYLIRKRLKPGERFALEPVRSPVGDYWRFKR